jgi:hypothetical protein
MTCPRFSQPQFRCAYTLARYLRPYSGLGLSPLNGWWRENEWKFQFVRGPSGQDVSRGTKGNERLPAQRPFAVAPSAGCFVQMASLGDGTMFTAPCTGAVIFIH